MSGRGLSRLRIGVVATVAGSVVAPAVAPHASAAPKGLPFVVTNTAKTLTHSFASCHSRSATAPGLGIASAAFGSTTISGFNWTRFPAYDCAFQLAVDGVRFTAPSGTVDQTGNVIKASKVMSALNTEVRYIVDNETVASLYSFTNNTGQTITSKIEIDSNLGSGGATRIRKTSSGDRKLTKKDVWFVSSDKNPDTGAPVNVIGRGNHYRKRKDKLAVPPGLAWSRDTYVEKHKFTLAPGQTIRFLYFAGITRNVATGISLGEEFSSTNALNSHGHLTGITTQEQNQVENWSF